MFTKTSILNNSVNHKYTLSMSKIDLFQIVEFSINSQFNSI